MSGLSFPTYRSIITHPTIKQTPVSISLRYTGAKIAGYYRCLAGSSTNNMIYLVIEPVNNYMGIFYTTTASYDSANFLSFGAGSAITDNTLYKIDLVISGTTALLYYSGSLVGSITDAKVSSLTSTYPLNTIGNNIAYSLFPSATLSPGAAVAPGANLLGHCNGIIYDYTVYNYARSTFEDPTTSIFDLNYGYDTTATAVLMNPDGAAITPATTNLVHGDPVTGFTTWGGFLGSSTTVLAPRNSSAVSVIGNTASVGTEAGARFYTLLKSDKSSDKITVTASTTYTLSCTIQSSTDALSANTLYVFQYDVADVLISEAGYYSSAKRYKMADGFDRAWGTFTTASNCAYIRIAGYIYSKHQIMLYDFQLEQRAVPTAYVAGSKAASVLSVPSTTIEQEGTISILWRVGEAIETYSAVLGVNWWTNPLTQDTINFYRGTGWDSGDRLGWMIFDGSTASRLLDGSILGMNTRIGHLLFVSLGWSLASKTGRVYVRDMTTGTVLASTTSTNNLFDGFSDLGPLYIGTREGIEPQNGVFRALSIYNRMLSAEELSKLATRSMGTTELVFTTSSYREQPTIPQDAHYFPLASDTEDSKGIVADYSNAGLAYEDGAVWVGTAATNYWTGSNPTEVGSGIITTYGANGPNLLPRWLFTKTGTDNQWHGWQDTVTASLAANSNFTISFYTRKETLGKTWSFTPYSADLLTPYGTTATGSWNTGNQWKKSWGTITFNQDVTSFVMKDGPSWDASASAGTAEIAGLMWEAKPFPSPYVLGTRAAGKLTYNLNTSVGLDWSGDWSICYWKKPVSTSDNTLTEYNIDSLGCNSNSVGGGYAFWGKPTGADTVGRGTYDAVNISTFFNTWHFISIVKSGTTVTWTWRLYDGQLIVKTSTLSGIAANYFVTQYGYDLQLGGWDNTNPCNTYFKDLIVVQRALSDSELINIYQQMRAKLESVATSALVEEGI